MTPEERKQQALEMHERTLQHLVDKGRLMLTVNVTTKEQAQEILEWMYGPEKPMTAELIELAWDKAAITKQEFDALEQLKAAILGG
jgi:hypothetical protein